jgi:hypothetical protein
MIHFKLDFFTLIVAITAIILALLIFLPFGCAREGIRVHELAERLERCRIFFDAPEEYYLVRVIAYPRRARPVERRSFESASRSGAGARLTGWNKFRKRGFDVVDCI